MAEAKKKTSNVLKVKRRISDELNGIDKDIKDLEKSKKESVEKIQIKKVELRKFSSTQAICDEHEATLQEIELASKLIEERKISISALDTTITNLDLQIAKIQSEHDKAVAELERKRLKLNEYLKYYDDLNEKLEKLIKLLGNEERKHCIELNNLKRERSKILARTDLSENVLNKLLEEFDNKIVDLNKEHGELIDSISQKLSEITVDVSEVEDLLSEGKKKTVPKKTPKETAKGRTGESVQSKDDEDADEVYKEKKKKRDTDADVDEDEVYKEKKKKKDTDVAADEDYKEKKKRDKESFEDEEEVDKEKKKRDTDKVVKKKKKRVTDADEDEVDREEKERDTDSDEDEEEVGKEKKERDTDADEDEIEVYKEKKKKEKKEKDLEDMDTDTFDEVPVIGKYEKQKFDQKILDKGGVVKKRAKKEGAEGDTEIEDEDEIEAITDGEEIYEEIGDKGRVKKKKKDADVRKISSAKRTTGKYLKDFGREDDDYEDSDFYDTRMSIRKTKKSLIKKIFEAPKKPKRKIVKVKHIDGEESASEDDDDDYDDDDFDFDDDELLEWFASKEKGLTTELRLDLLRQGLQITPSNRIITQDDRVLTLKEAKKLGLFDKYIYDMIDVEGEEGEGEEEESSSESESEYSDQKPSKKKKIKDKEVKYYQSPPSSASSLGKESSESHICGRDTEYLKVVFGKSLTIALAEITAIQPTDPIHYLAHWMLKYRYNQEIDQITRIQIQELMIEQEKLAAEKWHRELQEEARLAVLEALFRAENIIIQQDFQSELQLQEYEGEFDASPLPPPSPPPV